MNSKNKFSLPEKALLCLGWVFVVYQFVVGTYHLYGLIFSRTQNALMSVGTAICALFIVYFFVKSNNQSRLFLSKGYFLLSIFIVMCFGVIYIHNGSWSNEMSAKDLQIFLIMAFGVALIIYLSHKFFAQNHLLHIRWEVDKSMPSFSCQHTISGNTQIIRIKRSDKLSEEEKENMSELNPNNEKE